MDNKLKNIFIGFLVGALATTGCFAVQNNCANEFYRKNHPKQCPEAKSNTISDTTLLTVIGSVALAGAGIALAKQSSSGESGSESNSQNFVRSANINVNYALTDTIRNKKIYEAYIDSATHGSDISPETIEKIRNTPNYIKNKKHFDSIKMAWATARGLSGKNVNVNILDDFAYYHGFAVHEIVQYIARDSNIYDSFLTTEKSTFKSFDEIANIIKNNAPADIYTGSWQIKSTPYQNAATVAYSNFNPKTYQNAQEYMYATTSYNFVTQVINSAVDKDSIFVWAAGNDYQKESGMLSAMPLAFPELQGHFVNVVSLDPATNTLAWYSNECGVTQNYCIAAPGSSIQTNSKTAPVSGTSFATPIVAGAIAVIKEAFPYMNAQEITALLFTTAKDLGKPGVDEVYGWGLLDMEAATKPVGKPNIVLSGDNIIPLTEASVGGIASSAIKNAGINLAFIDDFGRAFTTSLSDNINIIPYGRAFAKLTEQENNSINLSNNVEFGFNKTNILESNGFISANASSLTNFIGYKNTFNIGNLAFYQTTHFGISAPKANYDSIISGFSNVYTTSIKTGLKYQDFGFEFAIPETIIHGNAYITLPTARASDGRMLYSDFSVDLTTRPSFEYSLKYKNISVGYINNPDYQDEFFILAKTKLAF